MSVEELVEGLDVNRLIGDRRWHIQKSCAISGQGLGEGMEWLCRAIQAASSSGASNGKKRGGSGGGEDFMSVSMSMSSHTPVTGGSQQAAAEREPAAADAPEGWMEKEQQ